MTDFQRGLLVGAAVATAVCVVVGAVVVIVVLGMAGAFS